MNEEDKLIYHNFEEIYSERESIVNRIRVEVGALSPLQLGLRAKEGGWSIQELLEHIVLVDRSIVRLLDALTGKAKRIDASQNIASGFPIDVTSLVEQSRREKYISRENARPTGTVTAQESLLELENIHSEVKRLRPRLGQVDISSVSFPHPFFGSLTLGQWLVFSEMHEDRHLNQMLSILSSLDIPVRGSGLSANT